MSADIRRPNKHNRSFTFISWVIQGDLLVSQDFIRINFLFASAKGLSFAIFLTASTLFSAEETGFGTAEATVASVTVVLTLTTQAV